MSTSYRSRRRWIPWWRSISRAQRRRKRGAWARVVKKLLQNIRTGHTRRAPLRGGVCTARVPSRTYRSSTWASRARAESSRGFGSARQPARRSRFHGQPSRSPPHLWVADVRLARLQQDRDRSPILLPSSLSDAPAASAMCAGVKDGPPDKTPCNLSCGEWAVAVVVQEACKISVVVTRL